VASCVCLALLFDGLPKLELYHSPGCPGVSVELVCPHGITSAALRGCCHALPPPHSADFLMFMVVFGNLTRSYFQMAMLLRNFPAYNVYLPCAQMPKGIACRFAPQNVARGA
jgi:hypothetical protein